MSDRPWIECVECGTPHEFSITGSGYCRDCETPEDKATREEMEESRYRSWLRASGMPEGLWRWTWDDWDASASEVVAAKKWAAEGGGLALQGPAGTGKTTLAATATLDAIRHRKVAWQSVASMILNLRRSFDDPLRESAVNVLTSPGPIVLDDLDKANLTEFATEALYSALDQRVVAGTPLLLTFNSPIEKFGEDLPGEFGEPIVSRIVGYCDFHIMDGDDRRLG